MDKDAHEELLRAFDAVMTFTEGRKVLRYLMAQTGYLDYVLRYDPTSGEMNVNASIYNAARRDMWLDIRRYLKPEHVVTLESLEMPSHDDRRNVDSDDDTNDPSASSASSDFS